MSTTRSQDVPTLVGPIGLMSSTVGRARSVDVDSGEPPTATLPRVLARRGRSSSGNIALSSGLLTLDRMRGEDALRTRMYGRFFGAVTAAACLAMLAIGGDPVAKAVAMAGLAVTLGLIGWFLRRVRDGRGFEPRFLAGIVVGTLLASQPTMYFWGLMSPASLVFALVISCVGYSADRSVALSALLTCALSQAVLTAGLVAGVVPDRSLLPLSSLGWPELVASQAVVYGMYTFAYVVARFNRRAARRAMERLEQATREAANQHALFEEVRADLNRVLGVGATGRHTGEVIGGFRIGHQLGHGAMGEVYDAVHVHSGASAAVKLLHRHTLVQDHNVRRFLREAEHASRLHTPHVVDVLGFGRSDDGVPYLAMERLDGMDLAAWLRERGSMDLDAVVELVRQVGAGLEAAREIGLVHRDIKPQNLFRSEVGQGRPLWKILDFGVATLESQSGTLTEGRVIGTPGYMAPEQVENGDIDHRADLFSLATVAYRALTGKQPFGGGDPPVVLYRVVYRMPEAPSRWVSLGEDVDLVLALALAKEPRERFESGAAFADALVAAAQGQLDPYLRRRARVLLRKLPWARERA
ncbi:protein kinase domain-containing protein [Haliangium sp.]|uniref:protein kinase domain-containing protein n=1 Tax=Haliangium sp. TaxID=2663208 RepID=UPI003D13D5C9